MASLTLRMARRGACDRVPRAHAELCTIMLLAALCASAMAQNASFTGLGALPSRLPSSSALAISADGSTIVGFSQTDAGERACVWRDGVIAALPGLPGSGQSTARAVSADGTLIIGQCERNGEWLAVRWRATDQPAELLTSSAGRGDVWGISADGATIVGRVDGTRPVAARWNEGKCHVLDDDAGAPATPSASAPTTDEMNRASIAQAISADGRVIVGSSNYGGDTRAVRWSDGKICAMATLPDGCDLTHPYALSADGRVVVGQTASQFGFEACRWDDGAITPLGALSPGHEFLSAARGVSADGRVIVGSSHQSDGTPRAFVWDAIHGMRWIDDVLFRGCDVPVGGWRLQEAIGISADGTSIIGIGRNPRGRLEAWLARIPASAFAPTRPLDAAAARRLITEGAGLTLGDFERVLGDLIDPDGAAIDDSGQYYVSDTSRNRVRIFGADGTLRRDIRTVAGATLCRPRALALDAAGALYIVDSGAHRICVLERDGVSRSFGKRGTADGAFLHPAGVAAARDRIYVADTGNSRLQIFDRNGQFIAAVGEYGAGDGQLNEPVDIAIGRERIFVADTGNHRVAVFDLEGRWIANWGERGGRPGMFLAPRGVAAVGDNVLIADTGNHRVQLLSDRGKLLSCRQPVALRPHETGRTRYPARIAIAPSGRSILLCEPLEDRCQIFFARRADDNDDAAPRFDTLDVHTPLGSIATDGAALALPTNNYAGVALLRRDEGQPTLLRIVGFPGSGMAQVGEAASVSIDARRRRISVADAGNRRLSVFQFDADVLSDAVQRPGGWRFVRSINFAESFTGDIASTPTPHPVFVTPTPDGGACVVEDAGPSVMCFDTAFRLRLRIANEPRNRDVLLRPVAAGFSRSGEQLYVVDADRAAILAFDREGNFLRSFGAGQSSTPLIRPSGIASGRDGFLYVTDAGADRICVYSESGELLRILGSSGIGAGEFRKPSSIVQDEELRLIVVDRGNERCQVLSPRGEFAGVFGSELYSRPARASAAASP